MIAHSRPGSPSSLSKNSLPSQLLCTTSFPPQSILGLQLQDSIKRCSPQSFMGTTWTIISLASRPISVVGVRARIVAEPTCYSMPRLESGRRSIDQHRHGTKMLTSCPPEIRDSNLQFTDQTLDDRVCIIKSLGQQKRLARIDRRECSCVGMHHR